MSSRRKIIKRGLICLGGMLVILGALFVFRYPIMRGAGNFLIKEDLVTDCQVMFVLSGNSWDRGREAAKLVQEGAADQVLCTGEEVNSALKTMGIHLNNADLTRKIMIDHGADSTQVGTLPIGTSTWEEYEAILAYCQQEGVTRAMVVSSKFHTRRIQRVFRDGFEEAGIELVVRGAPESGFDESEWWKQESGLIFLNNEYVKLLYYAVKY